MALKTANSRKEAAVAEYKVWLVTTAPTNKPRAAAYPKAIPALVLVSQCILDRNENSGLVKAEKF